jgi:hypothetical protein
MSQQPTVNPLIFANFLSCPNAKLKIKTIKTRKDYSLVRLSTRIDNLSNVARLRVSSLTRDLTSIADTKSFLENWEKGFKEFGKNFNIDYQIEGLDGGVMNETKTTDKPVAINLVFIDKDGKKIPLDGDFESLDIEGEHLELIVKVPNVKEIIPQRIPHRDPNDGDRHYHLFELNKENLELNANTIIREKDDSTRFHSSSTQFSITVGGFCERLERLVNVLN